MQSYLEELYLSVAEVLPEEGQEEVVLQKDSCPEVDEGSDDADAGAGAISPPPSCPPAPLRALTRAFDS